MIRTAVRTLCVLVLAATVSNLAGKDLGFEGATELAEAPGQRRGGGAEPALPGYGSEALQGPVDPTLYVVGPGDRFTITLWGQDVVSLSPVVTPEGELVLPGIATIDVAGRTLDEVKRAVRSSLSEVYRSVQITVSLVELRQTKVSVLGAVSRPGAYVGTALDLASELIAKAGGLRAGASERNITITRRDGTTERVDLVRYRNAGDLAANPPILDGDVIFVPYATRHVFAYGAVANPGRYELVEGETVASLIDIAGGFARGAVTDTVELREFVDETETRSETIAVAEAGSRLLRDGDQVYVQALNEWRKVRRVFVDGEVEYPGTYGINEGVDRLSDVLARAGGLTEEASAHDATLFRVEPAAEDDPEFQRLKLVPVANMSETEYAYFKTKCRERGNRVVVDLEKVVAGDEAQDVLLRDGDRIYVPKLTRTVIVDGQVANPGHVEYVPGKRYGHYVSRAGGYTARAQRGRVTVIRAASGEWVNARRAGEVLPGDTVWVPERPEGDWWTTLRDVAQFAASVATVFLLFKQI